MTHRPRGPGARDEVARYYDSNTRRFLALGGGLRAHAIHRQLWGPGVTDGAAAANYVNVLLGDAIEAMQLGECFELIDFGCGVGGTLFALAERFPASLGYGVTISQRQYELACRLSDEHDYDKRCRFLCGNFETLALGVQADVVFAIESFVHARSAAAFFASAAHHLKPRGRLVIIDDFMAGSSAELAAAAEIRDLRYGWRLSNLGTVKECSDSAEAAGFDTAEVHDLSPMVRLDRPRDRIVAGVAPVARQFGLGRFPLFANLIGGAALTRGLRAGSLTYRWLRFERAQAPKD